MIEVTQHDVGVIFEDIVDAEGLEDLDEVTDVLFLMRRIRRSGQEETIVIGTGLVADSATRSIGYSTQDDDLAVAGRYHQAWHLTFTSGEGYTFRPDNGGFNIVRVADDLRT